MADPSPRAPGQGPRATRPDIVLVMTDEQRFDWMGYASDGHFETPNLDRLAAGGVTFDQAYSAATTCVPSRTSLLTGLHHRRTPTEPGERALEQGFWTVARGLRAVGYETALIGRMHFVPVHADHGFDTMRMCENINPGSGYPAEIEDDYRAWLAERGRPDWRLLHPAPDGSLTSFNPGIPRTFPDDEQYHSTAWIERETTELLRRRDRDRPLFLVVSFPHPHSPYDPPEPYASRYRPEDAVMPTDGFDVNDCLTGQLRADLDNKWTKRVEGPEGRDLVRRMLTSVRALVNQIDDSVGHIVDELDLDRSVLFFTSDHGDYGGHRGLFTKVPWIPFEDLLRVPLFVTGGAVGGRPRRSSALVQSASFAATALDYAGVDVPRRTFDFPSIRPVLEADDDAAVPERSVISFTYPVIRRGRWKLITDGWQQDRLLFDLEDDPGERRSLADDPACAGVVDDLLDEMRRVTMRPRLGGDLPHPMSVLDGSAGNGSAGDGSAVDPVATT